MTPPEDQNGQYGAAYPGSGHDAFGGPGGGYAPAPGYPGYEQSQHQSPQGGGQSGYWQDQQPEWQPPVRGGATQPVEPSPHDEEPLIRPYAMTGGRTRPRYQLAIEALVSTTAAPDRIGSLLPEHQRICSLCTDIKSVAEISALLSMPLGVARILVADLAESGLVAIHQPAAGGESGGTPDVTLLERVLSGLRKL
ncbi:hypothetical protein ABIA32_004572 [Streptacidiphilus sp. MAP12-20]|uniref:DUF742 domain-containing protein n=1 Tax=Streptacidiphilus sp. MAP12-20 TaxID=3156299 RepID=UPI0035117F8A